MILLGRTLCSKNFIVVGTVHLSIHLLFLIGLEMFAIISIIMESGKQYVEIKFAEMGVMYITWSILITIAAITALQKRIASVLTTWLIFSVFEFVVAQFLLIYASIIITAYAPEGVGVLCPIYSVFVAMYLFYNICVVFSARNQIIQKKRRTKTYMNTATNQLMTTMTLPELPIPSTSSNANYPGNSPSKTNFNSSYSRPHVPTEDYQDHQTSNSRPSGSPFNFGNGQRLNTKPHGYPQYQTRNERSNY